MKYDSTADTLKHIKRVNQLLTEAAIELLRRGSVHDASKLEEPEKSLFDKYTPELQGLTYGSEEYKQSLAKLKPALDHHYARNSHHPDHWKNGIDDFDLFDLIEYFYDCIASSERQNDGNILKSMEFNNRKYNISDQLAKIIDNTAKRLKL